MPKWFVLQTLTRPEPCGSALAMEMLFQQALATEPVALRRQRLDPQCEDSRGPGKNSISGPSMRTSSGLSRGFRRATFDQRRSLCRRRHGPLPATLQKLMQTQGIMRAHHHSTIQD